MALFITMKQKLFNHTLILCNINLILLKTIVNLYRNYTVMLPTHCPSCKHQLKVKSLGCENCGTEVNGLYELSVLPLLSPEEQNFILTFVRKSGSLKEMAAHLKLSYPTVRNMLNDIISKIENYKK